MSYLLFLWPDCHKSLLWTFLLLSMFQAFEHYVSHNFAKEKNVRFKVCCGGNRGIYLRDAHELTRPAEAVVNVTPLFIEDITSK